MAKKIKPVKSASPKGKKAAPKKAVTKSASSKGKKPIAKKVVKKAAVKKAVTKPAAKNVKKAAVKPVSSKGKKAAPKKVIAKKAITNKIVKKAPVKKVAVKRVVKPAQPAKVVAKKKAAPVSWPVQLPDATVENAANSNQQMLIPDNGLQEAPEKTVDPVTSFDKNVFNKATSKGDPHSNRHFSSKPKNTIKPSGKKPLW